MKKWLCLCLLCAFVCAFAVASAEKTDYDLLTQQELETIIDDAQEAIERNFRVSNTVKDILHSVTKSNVARYKSVDEEDVSWRWFDWDYTREWKKLTVITEARLDDDYEALEATYYDNEDGTYRLIRLILGEELLVDEDPNAEIDYGIVQEDSAPEVEEHESKPAAEPQETPSPAEPQETASPALAKRGDKNDTVRKVQSMLIQLGYLSGSADGDFGGNTEKAVKAFQRAKGETEDGTVTEKLYALMESAVEELPEEEKTLTVTAKQLFKEYENNEFAADAVYGDQQITVTGTIYDFGEGILSRPYIELDTGNYFQYVECEFPDNKATRNMLAKLRKGTNVKVRGKCTGMGFMSVEMEDCEIVG